MYAMVNVEQYQIVETGGTVAECEANYRQTLAHAGLIGAGDVTVESGSGQTGQGIVEEIRTAVVDGNTHFYVRMEGGIGYLDFNSAKTPRAVLLDVKDRIWYRYVLDSVDFPENGIVPATDFRFEGEEIPGQETANEEGAPDGTSPTEQASPEGSAA